MTIRRLPEVARLKTSEVMRRAASELDAVDRVLASELRLRAMWIEVARQDGSVSEERRKGVAAIEDGEGR